MVKIRQLWSLLLAGILIFVSWWNILPGADFTQRTFVQSGTPMQFIAPRTGNKVPGILIVHGFSGSYQLMLGYANVLSHNGYGVLLWDLPGHGANLQPFKRTTLQDSFEQALIVLKNQPEIDPKRIAALGHSMGSGVAMTGGISHSQELDAVVAISPTDAAVTPTQPKNLQIQVGAWETPFIPNAKRLLSRAGGDNSSLAQGQGRSLRIIPNVEHATILFNDNSHQAALNWFNQTFGLKQTSPYRDRRMGWYGLHLLGWLIVIGTVLPILSKSTSLRTLSLEPLRTWGGLMASPIAAIVALKLMSLGESIDALGGLLTGGAVGFWFFFAGLTWLGILGKFPRPTLHAVKVGLIGFVLFWIGFGALAQFIWLPWFLTLPRFQLWLIMTLACLPWFLASGLVNHNLRLGTRFLWWLVQSLVLIIGFIVTIMVFNSLGFMAILLPVFPILMGLFSFIAAKVNTPWSYAIACAPLFAWMIVTPFPMV